MKKILYVGWIGFNNLGDECMWEAFYELSRKYLNAENYLVIPSLPGIDLKHIDPYDTIVLGGGSLLIPGYVDVVLNAVRKQKRVIVWGSGFDTQETPQLDEKGTLMNKFSAGDQKMRETIQAIADHASFFGVRGPLTYQYLDQLGVAGKVAISGDPGMLLTVPDDVEKAEQQTSVIGINWGTSYNRIYGKNEAVVEDALAETARQLIVNGHKIHLITMWGPDRAAVKRLAEKIGQPEQTIVDLELHDTKQMLRLLSTFTATINFKLHANVLSAAAGVPFVNLAYRLKSLDFSYSLDLPESIVRTDHPELKRQLLLSTTQLLDNRKEIIAKLVRGQEQAKERLIAPFSQQLF